MLEVRAIIEITEKCPRGNVSLATSIHGTASFKHYNTIKLDDKI